jgi:nitric oxide reductase large subunit
MFYFDLIAIWVLCGFLAAGFYNAYFQKEGRFRRKKNLVRALIFAIIWCVLFAPFTVLWVIYFTCIKRGWPYGWTLWWERSP